MRTLATCLAISLATPLHAGPLDGKSYIIELSSSQYDSGYGNYLLPPLAAALLLDRLATPWRRALLLVALGLTVPRILFEKVNDFERQALRETVDQVNQALDDERRALQLLVKDYAFSDDAHRFLSGRPSNFVEESFQPEQLASLDLDYVVLYDTRNRLRLAAGSVGCCRFGRRRARPGVPGGQQEQPHDRQPGAEPDHERGDGEPAERVAGHQAAIFGNVHCVRRGRRKLIMGLECSPIGKVNNIAPAHPASRIWVTRTIKAHSINGCHTRYLLSR